jgi:hypothetical protein
VDAKSLLDRACSNGELALDDRVTIQSHLQELNTLAHVFTRTKKSEVSKLFPSRRADPVPVEFSEPEQRFYDLVSEWVRLAHNRHSGGVGSFVLIMIQRQLASCLPAMAAKLEDTVLAEAIAFQSADVEEHLDVDSDRLGVEESEELTINMDREDLTLLEKLRLAWRDSQGKDAKFDAFEDAFTKLLEAGQRKVIVFSFFIRTIDYLAERLADYEFDGQRLEVFKLYGPTRVEERADLVKRFQDASAPAVLLSSEVGSEGLDFQFCSAMFNYDLPWNPMRVEQRIGRIDRYGQESEKIQVLNLVVPTTVEGRIFHRLYDRIGIFERSIGDLEAILGDRGLERDLTRLTREVVFGDLTETEQKQRTDTIAQAIERQQQLHEEFDEKSERFLGKDEVFSQRFHDVEEGQRFIHPDEIRNFVASYIAGITPSLEMRADARRDGLFRWRGRGLDDVYEAIRQYLLAQPDTTELDWQLASRLCDSRPAFTFDGEIATSDHTVEFVSAHHPIVRAAAEAFRAVDPPPAAGSLLVQAADVRSGIYAFYVFRLQISGARSALELEPVAIGTDGSIAADVSDRLIPLITRATASDRSPQDVVDEEFVARTHAAASEWIEARRAARETEVDRLADARLKAQLQSLDLGFERRVARIDARLEYEHHPNMVRLLTGQRRNLERRHLRKRHDVESQRDVAVGYDTVAAGVLEVVAPLTPADDRG